MKVSGFTFVRNALKFDYPIVESIQSILPLCDELIVNVARSQDGTLELILRIPSPKIKIIQSDWDDDLRQGGRLLSTLTDRSLKEAAGDWAFYIQADEVLHEEDIPLVAEAMRRFHEEPAVDGLLFEYLHFYGSYGVVARGRRWYRNEVRLIKTGRGISSWRDAQGFRKNGHKLVVARSGARIFHYGWVRDEAVMRQKTRDFDKLWHNDKWVEREHTRKEGKPFLAEDETYPFEGTHPTIMKNRVERASSKGFLPRPYFAYGEHSLREILLHGVERSFGVRLGEYRNYRLFKG